MRNADLTDSNSEGRRLIEQEAVPINDETLEDTGLYMDVSRESPFTLQVDSAAMLALSGVGRCNRLSDDDDLLSTSRGLAAKTEKVHSA